MPGGVRVPDLKRHVTTSSPDPYVQDAAKTEAWRTGSGYERAPGLYDQLVQLKDWREETAELCSAEARSVVFKYTHPLGHYGLFLCPYTARP